jgi:hypothetical protein
MTIVSSKKFKMLAAVLLVFAIVAGASTTMSKTVEATCSHRFATRTPLTYPTCSSAGINRCYCPECHYTWYESVPKTAHNYLRNIIRYPTCYQTGTAIYTCSSCGHSYSETLPKTSHQMYSIYRNGHTEWYCSICNHRFS